MLVQSLGQEDPWRRAWQPTSMFLPGETHGQRSLARLQSMGSQRVTRYLARKHVPKGLNLGLILLSRQSFLGIKWEMYEWGKKE